MLIILQENYLFFDQLSLKEFNFGKIKMYFQNISMENTDDNFYTGLMKWDELKLGYIIFQILLTFLAPTILFSIFWYERYGSVLQYRTLTNIIMSHICLISIVRCFISRIPYIAILSFSPFSSNTCDLIVFGGRYSF